MLLLPAFNPVPARSVPSIGPNKQDANLVVNVPPPNVTAVALFIKGLKRQNGEDVKLLIKKNV